MRIFRVFLVLVVLLVNRKIAHPAELYVADVLDERIPACQYVKQACQRQLDDLADAGKSHFPYYHDKKEAIRVINFFSFCKPSKGRRWANKPLQLMPWQQFMAWCTYGWMREDDNLRRFDMSYAEIPRKNGKSCYKSAEAVLLFLADGEPGAEVYVAATKEEQAKEKVWDESAWMVSHNPELKRLCTIRKKSMYDPLTASFYRPVGSDSKTQDGHNASGIIVDELHAHKNRKLWDVLDTSTDAREQPMKSAITTAGESPRGVCWEIRKQVINILKRTVRKEDWWGIIYTVDDPDDWENPIEWQKANPSLGHLIPMKRMEKRCELAQQLPSNKRVFLRYNLDVWVEGKVEFITKKLWESNTETIKMKDLEGQPCKIAVDLSSEFDLTAVVKGFELDDGYIALVPKFFCPEENIKKRSETDGVPYEEWRDKGLLIATPGNVVDYGYIEKEIAKDGEKYKIEEIAFDPRNALYLATRLGPEGLGYPVLKHHQTFAQMSPPSKMTQKMFMGGKVVHFDHPILRWCFMNTVVITNHDKDMRPSKKDSTERIDGAVASIMVVGRIFGGLFEDKGTEHDGMVTA